MRLLLPILPPVVALLLSAGCTVAPPGGADRSASAPWRSELIGLQQEQSRLSLQLETLRDSQVMLEARLQDQQQLLQELRRDMVAQRGTGSRETAEPAAPVTVGEGWSPTSSVEQNPSQVYLQAFSDYASGRFGTAIEGFQTFLSRFPANEFAPNARYWLGECYYSQQDFGRAAAAFQQLAENHPRADKAPEALWKRALALEQLGRDEAAEATIDLLLDRYGQSPAARKARERRP